MARSKSRDLEDRWADRRLRKHLEASEDYDEERDCDESDRDPPDWALDRLLERRDAR